MAFSSNVTFSKLSSLSLCVFSYKMGMITRVRIIWAMWRFKELISVKILKQCLTYKQYSLFVVIVVVVSSTTSWKSTGNLKESLTDKLFLTLILFIPEYGNNLLSAPFHHILHCSRMCKGPFYMSWGSKRTNAHGRVIGIKYLLHWREAVFPFSFCSTVVCLWRYLSVLWYLY